MKRMNKPIGKWSAGYKFRSIFFRNMCLLLALILIPVSGVGVLGSFAFNNIKENRISSYCEKSAVEIASSYNNFLNEVYMDLVYFGISSEVELFMLDRDFKHDYYQTNVIQNLIQMPVVVKDYVRSVYLYAAGSNMVIANSSISRLEGFSNKEIIEACLERPSGERTLLTTCLVSNIPHKCIAVCSDISYGKTTSGLAVANLDRKALIKEFDIPTDLECTIEKDGVVWLSSDPAILDSSAAESGWYDPQNTDYAYYTFHDASSGLDFILKLDLSAYQNEAENYSRFIAVFVLAVAWVTIIFAFFISARLFRPIKLIMETIHNASFQTTADLQGTIAKNEVEYILASISKSISNKRAMDIELAKRVAYLKQAQAVALQAQINPHFLNNTLETINWIAIENLGRNNEISDIAANLSHLLQVALDTTQIIVPVRTEIEHCKCYLEIQHIRYEDKLDVVWDIAEDILDFKIVKIVLQPLVENAIYHGIKPRGGKGCITVTGKLIENMVEITVADNGVGMTEEALRATNELLSTDELPEDSHIGVANVNQRIKLFFGNEYGLTIQSNRMNGTVVKLRIPQKN